jgi:type II secretory pathway pseudopilin PulG
MMNLTWRRRRACAQDNGDGDAGEAGFAIVEILIAMGIFAILAAGFAGALASSLQAQVATRLRTTADHLANEQVEQARALPYEQLGVVGGNPPGTLAASREVGTGGTRMRVDTSVTFRDDPIPGGFSTSANYKQVRITVTRVSDNKRLARVDTVVAPPTQPSLRNGVIEVRVMDFVANEDIPGALVRLQNGPGGTRSETSNETGRAIFPSLTPNPLTGPQAYYDVSATLSGYVTLRDDVLPAPSMRVQLAAGQRPTPGVRMYRPATIEVDLVDAAGLPLAGSATVVVSSARGSEAFTVTGGHLTITSVAGEPIVPERNLDYTIGATGPATYSPVARAELGANYPNELVSRFTFQPAPVLTQRLRVRVRDDANTPMAGVTVVAQGGATDAIALGVSNAGGEALLDVPRGSTEPWTVSANVPAGHDAGQTTVTLSTNVSSTTTATLVLPRSS